MRIPQRVPALPQARLAEAVVKMPIRDPANEGAILKDDMQN